MDFNFIYDYESKQHSVVVEGELSPIGRFLSNEFGSEVSVRKLNDLLTAIDDLGTPIIKFTEWTISVEAEELDVTHNSLFNEDSESSVAECDSILDWEQKARCGKSDFVELISAWIDFISS